MMTEKWAAELNNIDLEAYLKQNPNDHFALIYSAYLDEYRKWQSRIQILNDDLKIFNAQIANLKNQLNGMSIWSDLVGIFRGRRRKDLIQQILTLEAASNKAFDNLLYASQHAPQALNYQLAAVGNNLFRAI